MGEEGSALKLEGRYEFQASQEAVYALLLDPRALGRCLPGCERFEATGPDAYETVLKVGVGSVKGTYAGTVRVLEQVAPSHYRLAVEGTGSSGFLKGDGTLTLTPSPRGTTVSWVGEAQVGGPIAGVGQRMLGGVAKIIIGQFFKCLEGALATPEGGVK